MSIGAKPWEGGGTTSSNLNDVTNNGATTTNAITVGGVSIGTEYSLPTTDGSANQVLQTDGVGNVTFNTLDITGNLDYKGSYNATTSTPDLTTAEKGDFYIVSVAGSLAGVTLAVGDHIVFNQDASSPVTSAMFDKIDNTDAVASVNGQTGVVVLDAGDVGALAAGDNVSSLTNDANYVASGDNVSVLTNDANYVASGDNVSVLTNDAGYLTSAPVTSVNALTGVVVVSGNDIAADHTAANYTPANSNLDGHLSGIDTALGASASPTLDGVTTNGNTTSNDIEVGGVQVSGDITASSNLTRTIGAEAERFITYYGDVNGAVRFKAKNDSGAQMIKGQVVYIKGVSGTIPTVDLADADNASARPAFGLVYANANDQAEVQIVSFGNLEGVNTGSFSAGDTLYVSTTAGALTNSAPTGETAALQNIGRVVRSDASAGVIIVGGAGRSAATPNLDSGKIFLGNGSNQAVSTAISSINLSSFNDDLSYQPLDAGLTSISGLTTSADKMIYTTASDTYAVADLTSAGRALLDDADASAQRTTLGLGTAATSDSGDFLASTAGLDDLSDVAYTPGAGIDNYVLTYDHSTTSWGAEPAAGGSVALDGIAAGTGDATLATAGNITIDATATDADIIFRGTDGGVDTTFLTIDGSDGGTATFNHDIKMPTSGAQITMGPTNDVMITHVQNNGLLIELDVLGDGDFDPTVELKSAHTDQGGPRIRMNHSASDANNDIMGELSFEGKNATATQRIFGIVQGIKTKGANALENGKILISPMNGGTLSTADGLSIEGSDGDALVTVLQHDGSSQGLVLGSTLLTSTATELNILDVSAAAPSANDVLSYDGVNLSWTALSYQPLDAGLTSISGLTTAADKMIYTTASDTYAVADLTSAGRALLDDADASAQRTTLGLGTAATSASTDFLASTAGLNDLSDVSFSAGAGIDNYVLTYDHATTSWGAEPAAGGGGGTSYTYSAVSAATVTGAAWYHYSVDTSSNAVTINLPALSGLTDGDEIRVKLRDNTNTLTIDASGTETIDGQLTLVMNTQYEAVTLVAGSTEWEII